MSLFIQVVTKKETIITKNINNGKKFFFLILFTINLQLTAKYLYICLYLKKETGDGRMNRWMDGWSYF